MNSRERILAAINHQQPDRVPIDLGATPSSGISVVAYQNLIKYMGKTPQNIRMDPTLFPDWRTNATRTEIYGTEGLMYLGRHGGGWQVKGEDSVLIAQGGGIFPDNDHQKDFIESLRTRKNPNGDVEQAHLSASLIHFGNIAYRVNNKQLNFDGLTERFVGNEAANNLLRRSYRDNYKIQDKI